MEIGDSLGAGFIRPVDRAAPFAREQREPVVGSVVDRSQVQQLRLDAAWLRREIVELRGEAQHLSRLEHLLELRHSIGSAPEPAGQSEPVTYARKSYAANPLGAVGPRSDAVPPPALLAPAIENHPAVTNLGTLIDVLA